MPQAAAEQRLLKLSIAVTIAVAAFGVVFGLLSSSMERDVAVETPLLSAMSLILTLSSMYSS